MPDHIQGGPFDSPEGRRCVQMAKLLGLDLYWEHPTKQFVCQTFATVENDSHVTEKFRASTLLSMRAYLRAVIGPLWEDNEVQFARLICELVANNEDLCEDEVAGSMDLSQEELTDIFNRANTVWEQAKRDTCS